MDIPPFSVRQKRFTAGDGLPTNAQATIRKHTASSRSARMPLRTKMIQGPSRGFLIRIIGE